MHTQTKISLGCYFAKSNTQILHIIRRSRLKHFALEASVQKKFHQLRKHKTLTHHHFRRHTKMKQKM